MSLAFQVYWNEDVLPVFSKGYCPPLVMGFRQYLMSDGGREIMERNLEKEIELFRPDPYDTHPTLKERMAALEGLSGVNAAEGARGGEDAKLASDNSQAISLLGKDEREIEREFETWLMGICKPPLSAISWDDVGKNVWEKIWKERAAALICELTKPVRAIDLPRLVRESALFLSAKAPPELAHVPPDVRRVHVIVSKIAPALADAMIKQGWSAKVYPGSAVTLEKEGVRFKPFESIVKLAKGELDEGAWRAMCRDASISDLLIGPSP
jgi:hypothetical protein